MAIKIGGTTVIDDSRNITNNIGTIPASKISGSIPIGNLSTATTQAESDSSTKIATTAYVTNKITTLIGGAPSTLNDLNELAAAINDDANYNTTLTTALATKLPLAGGTMTGDVLYNDNVKAKFGAGSDLEIFHQSSNGNSIIRETGSGILSLQSNGSEVSIYDTANGNNMGRFITGAEVQLQHNGDTKFSTTATGINVTGNIAVSGTVDGRDVATDGTKLDGIATNANNYSFPHTVSEGSNAGTVVKRTSDGNGYIFADYYNGTGTFSTTGVTSGMGRFTGTNGNDTYGRSYTAAAARTLLNVENGATADQTAAQILTAIKTVDGAGSGLDADTVDGVQASSFLRSDANDTYTGLLSLGNTSSRIHGSDTYPLVQVSSAKAYFGSTSRATTVLASSSNIKHNRAGTEYDIWTSYNDGSGSGLDADTVDGIHGSSFLLKTGGTVTGILTASSRINTGEVNTGNGQHLVLNAGETRSYATGQTGEQVYLNAEAGIQINSTPDNWVSGWAGRNTTTISNAAGDSQFGGNVGVSGNITGVTDLYVADQIIHTGDTDTYMQFHAADQWRVVTGGTERLEVNNNNMTVSATLSMNGHQIDMNNNDIIGVNRLTHEGDSNTYIEFHTADQWRAVVGGSERLEVNTIGCILSGTFTNVTGDLILPSKIIHTDDTDTYTQFHEANQWRVVTGGTERLEVNNSQITSAEPIHAPSFHGDGSALTGIESGGGSLAFTDGSWSSTTNTSSNSFNISGGTNGIMLYLTGNAAANNNLNSNITCTVNGNKSWGLFQGSQYNTTPVSLLYSGNSGSQSGRKAGNYATPGAVTLTGYIAAGENVTVTSTNGAAGNQTKSYRSHPV